MRSFRLIGLDPRPFQPLFDLSDEELRERGALRRIVDECPGAPCRVSLEDAAVGEEVLLLPYPHHAVDSPYRASGPIFVRRGAAQRRLDPGELPPCVTRRLISLRAYDGDHLMVSSAVSEGPRVAQALHECFADRRVAYVHLHNAKPGCFSCEARPADG